MKLSYVIKQLERQIKFDIVYGLSDDYYEVCFKDKNGERMVGEELIYATGEEPK